MNRFKNIKALFGNSVVINSNGNKIFCNGHEIDLTNDFPNFTLNQLDKLTALVADFYNEVKFPNYAQFDDYASLFDKGKANLFTRKLDEELGWNINILEVGCGTGQLSLFLGRGLRRICAIDISIGSLILGECFRKRHDIGNVYFMGMDVFDLKFKRNSFDIVISNGALHHTKDPKTALRNIVEVTKPGGLIIIGLYHRYGRISTVIKQKIAHIIGNKIKYFDQTLKNLKGEEKQYAWMQDQFFNPHETLNIPKEILLWFDENDIEFMNLVPHFDIENENLLQKRDKPSLTFFKEFLMMFNKVQIAEGGFFVIIGRKKKIRS